MFGAVSRSDPPPPPGQADLPVYVRAAGSVAITCHRRGAKTSAATVRQEGALRVRFPNAHGEHLEATLINIAGGAAGGDCYAVSVEAMRDARLVVSTPAAEKIYRAIEAPAIVETRLVVGAGAFLGWLPQETILFDRARLTRRMSADLAADATATLCEMTILGRTDMGEAITSGAYADHWRIRRGGRLVYADSTRLDGPVSAVMARSAVGAGACAFATVLHIAPQAEALIEAARENLGPPAGPGCEAGVSAYDSLLVARFVARTGYELRRAVTSYLTIFNDLPCPRVWNS